MKKLLLLFLLIYNCSGIFAQWTGTSSYFGGDIYSRSSSPEAVCILTSSGVSMVRAKDQHWKPILELEDLMTDEVKVQMNDEIIVVAENYFGNCHISHDGGVTWEQYDFVDYPAVLLGIMDQTIIIIDQWGEFYYSTDFGKNWKRGPDGLNHEVSLAATMDNEVFAIQHNNNTYRDELLRCSFDGENFSSWEVVKTFAEYDYHSNSNSFISYDGVLYKSSAFGVMKSLDRGYTWLNLGYNLNSVDGLACDSLNLYASDYGFFKYSFENHQWSTILQHFSDTCVSSIAACNGSLYADLYQSDYPFNSLGWCQYLDGNFIPVRALPLAITKEPASCIRVTDNVLFTSVKDSANYESFYEVFFSGDEGLTWNQLEANDSWLLHDAIKSGSNFLLAGEQGVAVADTQLKCLFGTTGIYSHETFSLAKFGTVLFAGTNDGIYTSVNDGMLWNYKYLKGKIVFKIKVCRDTLFAGTDQGLFYSTDGVAWGTASGIISEIRDIAETTENLFVISDIGLLKKNDSLNTWVPVGSALIGTDITSICSRGNRLYLGTAHGTVLYSDNGGDSWIDISDACFTHISGIDMSANRLYVSELNSGVSFYPIGWPSDVEYKTYHSPELYPNPVKDWLSIRIPPEFERNIEIEIFNSFGISVKRQRVQATDVNLVRIMISDLSAGFYVLNMKNCHFSGSSRFIKVN